MKLTLSTQVEQSVQKVKAGFNIDLFKLLAPPFPKLKVKRFDGCSKDDLVELELDFIIQKQSWVSLIIFDRTSNEKFEFIDIGEKLPFPFKSWKHHHIVEGNHKGSIITDDIEFRSGMLMFDYLLFPLLYLQFIYRKPVYKKVFAEN